MTKVLCLSIMTCVVVITSSCIPKGMELTKTREVPYIPTLEVVLANKIDLNVLLVLSPDYQNAKYDEQSCAVCARFIISIGHNLTLNSERVVNKVFENVTVVGRVPKEISQPWEVVLTPRVIKISDAYGESTMTILTEWTLHDDKGNIIWAKTVKGTGRSSDSKSFFPNQDEFMDKMAERAKLMLDDLFNNLTTALLTISERRRMPTSKAP
jgi:hypothetical protein